MTRVMLCNETKSLIKMAVKVCVRHEQKSGWIRHVGLIKPPLDGGEET